ncbi:MAG: hypothetical protein JXB03_12650 [Spirochaetales bacterium]|nr:hypothetical protein [Spirochaetales bacterium]
MTTIPCPALERVHHLEGETRYGRLSRLCAFAETLWLDPRQKDYDGVLKRLAGHRKRLSALGVHSSPFPR